MDSKSTSASTTTATTALLARVLIVAQRMGNRAAVQVARERLADALRESSREQPRAIEPV
jgi:transcriptional regulator GlxA family with amidase domain